MVAVSEIKMGEKLNVLLFLLKPIVFIENILTGNTSDFPLQGDNIVKTLEALLHQPTLGTDSQIHAIFSYHIFCAPLCPTI